MLSVLLLSGCFRSSPTDPDPVVNGGGGGTETEGFVVNPDKSPAVSARVTVRPADYLQDLVSTDGSDSNRLDTQTDSRGHFILKGLPPGSYRVEIDGSEAGGSLHDFSLANDSQKVKLSADTLKPQGSILGAFVTDSDGPLFRIVQVFGMERLITADVEGGFVIYNLPEGTYDIRCSSLQPFRRDAVRRGIQVLAGQQTRITSVQLEKEAKLAYSVDSTGLKIGGVDGGNPIILDNELWGNGVENEYVWAKAALGAFDLRGNIVTQDMSTASPSIAKQMATGREELRLVRICGFRNIPDLTPGAPQRLLMPANGIIDSLQATPSAGSDLIVAEARKATPEKPLVVVVGGPMTTVAQAYLTDPSIATRMVVAGVFTFNTQGSDTLANYLVAKKCRFVQWGRAYSWGGGKPDTTRNQEIPQSIMGDQVRGFLANPGFRNLPYGDMAPAAFLANRGVWKTAEIVKVNSLLQVQPASDLTFDFLDIPDSANRWTGYTDELYSALGDPRAYAPHPVPGAIPADGYLNHSGAAILAYDSTLASGGAAYTAGAWTEYRVNAAAAGKYAVTVRYRSAAGSHLSVGAAGHAAVEGDLPAAANWTEAEMDSLSLDAGVATLRVSSSGGKIDVLGLDLK